MPKEITDGFTKEDDSKLCALLDKWFEKGGGAFSDVTFEKLARTIPQPCVEFVTLRRKRKNIEVLLIPRSKTDNIWSGMLHSAGGSIRRMDYFREDKNPINGVMERVQKNELGCNFLKEPVFVGMKHYMTNRGPEVVHIYYCEIPKNTVVKNGTWLNVEALGTFKNFIKHQIVPITFAVEAFKKNSQG